MRIARQPLQSLAPAISRPIQHRARRGVTLTTEGSSAVAIATPVPTSMNSPEETKKSRKSPDCVTHSTPDSHTMRVTLRASTRTDHSVSNSIIARPSRLASATSLGRPSNPIQTYRYII